MKMLDGKVHIFYIIYIKQEMGILAANTQTYTKNREI